VSKSGDVAGIAGDVAELLTALRAWTLQCSLLRETSRERRLMLTRAPSMLNVRSIWSCGDVFQRSVIAAWKECLQEEFWCLQREKGYMRLVTSISCDLSLY
jgi:hypothetical protein